MNDKREAKVELKSSAAGMDGGLREARRKLKSFEREQARAAKQAERDAARMRKEILGAGRGLLGGIGQGMQMAFGFQVLGGIEGMARGVFDFNEQLMRFGLAARKTPEQAQAIGAAARQIATETGLAAATVLAGARAFVDLAGAENYSESMMRTLARTAQASGAAIGDMATVAYSLQNALHIKPEEMEDVIGGLINQSKDGTIHFQNMAQEIIALGPKFARFGVLGRQGASELGAMVQVAGSGFKDAAEASTGIQGLFRGLQLHEDKFRAAGVATMTMGKDGAKHLRPLEEIVNDISKSSLIKDPSKLLKAIGRGEGDAFLRLWIEQIAKYKELVEAAQANGVVQKDLATVTESTSGRIAIAMEKAKNAFAEMLTPALIGQIVDGIESIVNALPSLVDKIESAVGLFMKFVSAVQWVKNQISDVDDANPFKAEGDAAAERDRAYHPMHRSYNYYGPDGRYLARPEAIDTPASPEEVAAHDRDVHLMGRAASWHGVARRLQQLAPGTPNEAAVRAAIEASKEVYANGKPNEGAQTAGEMYLENVPSRLLNPVLKKIADEKYAATVKSHPYSISTQDVADEVSKTMVATPHEQAMAKYRELAEQPRSPYSSSAQDIADAVSKAMANTVIKVQIGPDPIHKAAKNAPALNTRPGGRQ